MTPEQEARMRRNYVSNMYPGLKWKADVAEWGQDRVNAVYLRFIRDDQKPKPDTPEQLERDIREDPPDEQFKLF